MTPLEAARRMLDLGPMSDSSGGEYGEVCPFCEAGYYGPWGKSEFRDHPDDCPWLVMPQIVAALEAAEVKD